MSEQQRRKDLVAEYQRNGPEAGVWRIVDGVTGKALIGTSTNLSGTKNRFEFAQSTNTIGGLDHRLHADAKEHGFAAFRVEVVEVLERRPEATEDEVRADLAALEALVREGIDPDLLY